MPLAAGTALAQEDQEDDEQIEEIVTVARKRGEAEAVQEVPIAVSAFGAEQLDALFVTKIDDLGHLMPNVQLEAVGTFPGVQNFSIRGQGINSSIPSVDPTVGVFVDGVFVGTTYGVVLDTFDLESIEVLRGPQGLLFGRNVTGGAVLLRNARPNGEFGAKVRVGMTDEEHSNVAAAIEGSLIEDRQPHQPLSTTSRLVELPLLDAPSSEALGDELAETLYGSGDPVGQIFRLHGSPFTVVGVMKPKEQDSSYSGRDKDKLLIPGSTQIR